MLTFHKDKKRYFDMQYQTSKQYILPFIQEHLDLQNTKLDILELGCAEAGVLKTFTDLGHRCTGIELSTGRLDLAREFFSSEIEEGKIRFSSSNLYDLTPGVDGHLYDLIILKDVIEHIPDQEAFVPYLKSFLKPSGMIFFGFPPWCMPFGGHQQLCRNKWLRRWAWMHLTPRSIYEKILKAGENNQKVIDELMAIHDTSISINRFNRIVKASNLHRVAHKFWLFNPIYQWKFDVSPRRVVWPFSSIPYIRDFYTTAYYVLVKNNTE